MVLTVDTPLPPSLAETLRAEPGFVDVRLITLED
jgi:hypothetical protein